MKSILKIVSGLVLVVTYACNSSDDPSPTCLNTAIINNFQYENAESAIFDINAISIDGDCLTINFSASGCDGNTWQLQVYDSGDIIETSPPQRNVRLVLFNNEACLAYITKDPPYDISSLQVEGGQVVLNIINNNSSITYNY